MRILAPFNGMNCGRLAVERIGIQVEQYYSSEINKHAIQVTQRNHPDTVQIGDITAVNGKEFKGIDLLMGGSPCQGFSFAGKQLNFNDPRSKLLFEFVRLIEEAQPRYFLLENVRMKREYADEISKLLGVQPVRINSSLVSAQNRDREYWTNIPIISVPEDRGIMLSDIVHENTDHADVGQYKVPITKSFRILDIECQKRKIAVTSEPENQGNRVYTIHGKAVTLLGECGGGAAKMGQYLFGCISPDRENKRQNGQRFSIGDKFYTLTAQDRHGILTDGYIRKLTPVECERLQTVPDGFTEGVSETQRYKMLGNGWTVDVIAHILGGIK